MLDERRAKIVEMVNEKGRISFSILSREFPDVSEMTLRKDLKSLDSERKLVRIYGGARSLDTVRDGDMPLQKRLEQNSEAKRRIALKAKDLIIENGSFFLDSGSTVTELAKVFGDVPCTVFCSGLSCLNELSKLKRVEIYVLGGRLNKDSLSVRDSRVVREISALHFDAAFISVNGFTRENGFSCRSSERWEMEKALIKRAAKVIVLMDSSKVGIEGTFSICKPKEIDMLITDDGMEEETRAYLIQQGVEVR